MLVQLVPNLNAQISLPSYTFAQSVQLLVLLVEYVLVVFVYLLVVERVLVGRRVGVVAVGEECGAVCVVFFFGQGGRLGRVCESD